MLRNTWHIEQVQNALQDATVVQSDLKTQLHSKFLDHCCSFVYLLYCCAACWCHCCTRVYVCLQPFAFVFAGKSHFLEPATQHAAPLLPSPLPLMAVSYTVRLKCALIVLLHCLQWHFTAVASRCRVCLRLCSPVCAYLLMRLSNAFYEYFLAVCRFTASNSPALCGPLMPDKLLMLMLLQP